MSCKVSGKTIYLTRGDTFRAIISIYNPDGSNYICEDGDQVRFAMNKTYGTDDPLIFKEIPIDTMMLTINPDDTKDLEFGNYVYDVQLTHTNGDIDTFITKASFKLTEEVE